MASRHTTAPALVARRSEPLPRVLTRLLRALPLSAEARDAFDRTVAAAEGPSVLVRTCWAQGWLTTFQACAVLEGRGEELARGPYVLTDWLGAGGMGIVYRARHVVLRAERAVKVLRPELLAERWNLDRFRDEVEALGRLRHANVVTAHDALEEGGPPALVME